MASTQTGDDMANMNALDSEHSQIFQNALMNTLTTELAEHTYAQILDGLPTKNSLLESCSSILDHPVCKMEHTAICEGYLDKAREFRSSFDPSTLLFNKNVLAAFQGIHAGSKEFNLRLIELVAVACHQIGAFLFELDSGAHKHEVHNSWLARVREEERDGSNWRCYRPPPAAFFHRFYDFEDQYPRGAADVAGYWAEGRIFGGVVVFDRGESEQECKDMWIHGILNKGPQTLYPPTADQFEALIAFLLSDKADGSTEPPCPLPIHGTRINRPRWDSMDSMNAHIFRDRHERRIPATRPPQRVTHTFGNWPELEDNWVTMELMRRKRMGEPVDEEMLKKAHDGLLITTPSSPLWWVGQRGK